MSKEYPITNKYFAIPPGYRLLEAGSKIQAGDKYISRTSDWRTWIDCRNSVNTFYNSKNEYHVTPRTHVVVTKRPAKKEKQQKVFVININHDSSNFVVYRYFGDLAQYW